MRQTVSADLLDLSFRWLGLRLRKEAAKARRPMAQMQVNKKKENEEGSSQPLIPIATTTACPLVGSDSRDDNSKENERRRRPTRPAKNAETCQRSPSMLNDMKSTPLDFL